ncbi:MAG: alternative ribosome rescue aminoacyl-tRNA hydrolase ArfB [Nitrospirales bacterium]|nr:aminoacyl-tRNA hydrolase [Nitrospirales bacterium]
MGVVISQFLEIPDSELQLTAVRSRGPGGQHVNKVSTGMVLEFNLQESATLNDWQKQRLVKYLKPRINQQGILRLQAQRHRSQSANRQEVIEKFVSLLQESFRPTKARVPTRIPKQTRERRLIEKKQRSQIKGVRKSVRPVDE